MKEKECMRKMRARVEFRRRRGKIRGRKLGIMLIGAVGGRIIIMVMRIIMAMVMRIIMVMLRVGE